MHEPPDLFQEVAFHLEKDWVNEGFDLEPIDFIFDDEGWREHFLPEVLDAVTVNGEILAVPVNVHRENGVFYSVPVFSDLGLTPPMSQTPTVPSREPETTYPSDRRARSQT